VAASFVLPPTPAAAKIRLIASICVSVGYEANAKISSQ
jgi:hypothetical protein